MLESNKDKEKRKSAEMTVDGEEAPMIGDERRGAGP